MNIPLLPIKAYIPCPFTLYKNGITFDKRYKDIHKTIKDKMKRIRVTNNTSYKICNEICSYSQKEIFKHTMRLKIKEDLEEIKSLVQHLRYYKKEIEATKYYLAVFLASYKPLLSNEEENEIIEFISQQHCSTQF